MMKIRLVGIFVFILLLSFVSKSNAQTVQFTQSNVLNAIQAQALEYRVYLTPSGAVNTNTPVLLTNITCVAVAGQPNTFSCTALNQVALSAALITGAKSELTAKETNTMESQKSTPFFQGANVPSLLKVTP